MDFRLATITDLPHIKNLYKEIIKCMNDNNIQIWDDIYPSVFFENDIKNNQFYLLLDNNEIVSSFVLCDKNIGEQSIEWKYKDGKTLYLDRLGVNVNYSRKGIASFMLDMAKKTAKNAGVNYLRLFVVDTNEPAINLYKKNGFTRAKGIYDEVLDDNFILREYGYEVEV